jgi:biopolymer transport protein ExbD
MKLRTPGRRSPQREENLIPMINIVFLLLIFFMLAGRLLPPEALPVEPPRASGDNAAEPPRWLLLIAADGRLALADQVFPLAQLETRLTPYLNARPRPPLTVKADAGLTAERLLDVLEALRAAGVERLLLLGTAGAD